VNRDEYDERAPSLEALGILACGIAHDFNNILGGIVGLLELVDLDAESPSAVRAHVREMRQATARAADLLRQVLRFGSRSGADRRVIRLDGVTREALVLLRSALPKSIHIDTQVESDAPAVLADPSQVHRVLVNLGANAAYAMRGTAGTLAVRLGTLVVDEAHPPPRPEIEPGRYAHLVVSDDGTGMDTETQQRIFERFFTTKARDEGTGLGLAVVHGIVSDHDGHVFVDSAPGEGARFHVLFREHVVETSRIPHAGHTLDV
jgi:signal transduction histidine kinase